MKKSKLGIAGLALIACLSSCSRDPNGPEYVQMHATEYMYHILYSRRQSREEIPKSHHEENIFCLKKGFTTNWYKIIEDGEEIRYEYIGVRTPKEFR